MSTLNLYILFGILWWFLVECSCCSYLRDVGRTILFYFIYLFIYLVFFVVGDGIGQIKNDLQSFSGSSLSW